MFGPKTASLVEVAAPVKRKLSNPIFKPLVWIDCEMTGLNVYEDNIIEICCIITDGHLNVIDEQGYESTVYVDKRVLDGMNEWCVNQHGSSGLTSKVLANQQQTLAKVQRELLEYIQSYIPDARTGVMAGNSIHMDKFFMMREFPQVIEHLHYRLVDVSSIMEVGRRHNPKLMDLCPRKQGRHTARADILESINQLKWYKENYLRSDIPLHLSQPEKEPANSEEPANKKMKLQVTPCEDSVEIDEVEIVEEIVIEEQAEQNDNEVGEVVETNKK